MALYMTHWNPLKRVVSRSTLALLAVTTLNSCVNGFGIGASNMGGANITPEIRAAQIAAESPGGYFYGRRYFVNKTRFWGYLRSPRQPWAQSKLVVMNESLKYTPDRLPESGDARGKHGMDQNHEYKVHGRYTGRKVYDPATNLFLPEFRANRFELVSTSPGWLFKPEDYYSPDRVTLVNASVGTQAGSTNTIP